MIGHVDSNVEISRNTAMEDFEIRSSSLPLGTLEQTMDESQNLRNTTKRRKDTDGSDVQSMISDIRRSVEESRKREEEGNNVDLLLEEETWERNPSKRTPSRSPLSFPINSVSGKPL